jgi:hypothetical protein
VSDPLDAAGHDGGHVAAGEGSWPGDDVPRSAAVPEPPEPPVTGDPVVDEVVSRLPYVTSMPVEDQPEIYDAVHQVLTERLADVEG